MAAIGTVLAGQRQCSLLGIAMPISVEQCRRNGSNYMPNYCDICQIHYTDKRCGLSTVNYHADKTRQYLRYSFTVLVAATEQGLLLLLSLLLNSSYLFLNMTQITTSVCL